MINALTNMGHSQFEWARYSVENYLKYTLIQVARVSAQELRYNPVLQNLLIDASGITVKTSYFNDYKPRQHILYRDKWYVIRNVATDEQPIAPQALGLVAKPVTTYYLELTEDDGYDAS